MSTGTILVVDDEPDLRAVYELALVREGYEVDTAGDVTQAREFLENKHYQVLITDMRLPDGIGLDLVKLINQTGRAEKCLVVTAYGSAENAVEALKCGAFDYLTKPVDLKQLRTIVASALMPEDEHKKSMPDALSEAAAAPQKSTAPQGQLLGESRLMQEVRNVIAKVAPTMAPVLVRGESGTGKELVSRAIHQCSHRAKGPFVAVNCGAIPENLVEAEFFGYRKGAFTGAHEDRQGLFSAAAGGTLFLDEIGELPLSMQAKLLRVIQERAVRAVGSNIEEPIDVRIVSATHRNLNDDVKNGRFRQDLFYRLNVIEVFVPSLRERSEDIPQLAQHILNKICLESGMGQPMQFEPLALDMLRRYSFPGNVRELENVLQRAIAMSDGMVIRPEDLALDTAERTQPQTITSSGEKDALFHEEVDSLPKMPIPVIKNDGEEGLPCLQNEHIPLPRDITAYLNQVERHILVQSLEENKYNRTAAAARLGLSLRQIRYRMEQLGIDVPEESK